MTMPEEGTIEDAVKRQGGGDRSHREPPTTAADHAEHKEAADVREQEDTDPDESAKAQRKAPREAKAARRLALQVVRSRAATGWAAEVRAPDERSSNCDEGWVTVDAKHQWADIHP